MRSRTRIVARRLAGTLVALALMGTVGACGDDDPFEPDVIDLDTVVGIYDPVELEFDPQGSAPPADVLPLIQRTQPQLVISHTGIFQLAFLDPVTNLIRTPGGEVEATEDGIRLIFSTQAAADQLLLPETLELMWDPTDETLSFQGGVEISRARLLELFPELYAEEQLFDPTPGTLTAVFEQREGQT